MHAACPVGRSKRRAERLFRRLSLLLSLRVDDGRWRGRCQNQFEEEMRRKSMLAPLLDQWNESNFSLLQGRKQLQNRRWKADAEVRVSKAAVLLRARYLLLYCAPIKIGRALLNEQVSAGFPLHLS